MLGRFSRSVNRRLNRYYEPSHDNRFPIQDDQGPISDVAVADYRSSGEIEVIAGGSGAPWSHFSNN